MLTSRARGSSAAAARSNADCRARLSPDQTVWNSAKTGISLCPTCLSKRRRRPGARNAPRTAHFRRQHKAGRCAANRGAGGCRDRSADRQFEPRLRASRLQIRPPTASGIRPDHGLCRYYGGSVGSALTSVSSKEASVARWSIPTHRENASARSWRVERLNLTVASNRPANGNS